MPPPCRNRRHLRSPSWRRRSPSFPWTPPSRRHGPPARPPCRLPTPPFWRRSGRPCAPTGSTCSFSPSSSLPQRKHRYYEVFSRIRRADGAHLLPEQYLPVAQRAGLIAGIDNMLLFRCIQLLRETEKRHQAVGFFYNISAATLADRDFMEEFASYLGRHPNLAAKLVFELGQAELMPDGSFSTGFLDGLRRLGFRFSMDQVERLEVDWAEMARHEIRHVKLDAARLLDPAGPFADPQAARDLKGLLDRNAIDLIAEKVETDRQLLELLDLHIDFGQGYLFGEPKLARKAG
ncbi:EAL domain-containing protein [Indioceanicola profundi]|uniref:EAL domain-containing protein n=1 Tax=Indioceanicola profundi TaxID=2220096 RepID=UPI0013C4F83E|nr:EAL domain-containing protein [Indioceanicola profundi]